MMGGMNQGPRGAPRGGAGSLRHWLAYVRLVGLRDAVGTVHCPYFCGWQGRYFHYRRHWRRVHASDGEVA
jgi:hypothetical protein